MFTLDCLIFPMFMRYVAIIRVGMNLRLSLSSHWVLLIVDTPGASVDNRRLLSKRNSPESEDGDIEEMQADPEAEHPENGDETSDDSSDEEIEEDNEDEGETYVLASLSHGHK